MVIVTVKRLNFNAAEKVFETNVVALGVGGGHATHAAGAAAVEGAQVAVEVLPHTCV